MHLALMQVKGWSRYVRETYTFDYHAQHVWLHFFIRLLIVVLFLFLLLVLAGDSLGESPALSARLV